MIKNLKNKLFFLLNYIFNVFYQKIKYDKKYLISVSNKEILKHEGNFYEKRVKERTELNFDNTFNFEIDKLVLDNSISLCDPINPLVATGKELLSDPNIKLEETYLFKYFQSFKPKNLMEVFFLNIKENTGKNFPILNHLNQYTLFYPWFHKYPQRFLIPGMFGPKDISFPKLRYIRLKNLIYLIKKYDYMPDKDDQICGYKLVNDNDHRFVITAGSHRSSVLKALNKKTHIAVKFDNLRVNKNFFEIKIQNIKNWPGVSGGYMDKKEAERMFLGFFELKTMKLK
tara:strand:+ start:2677 stop:3531 length:855 start_codon:yes stop_codon:yes gene_type:complete